MELGWKQQGKRITKKQVAQNSRTNWQVLTPAQRSQRSRNKILEKAKMRHVIANLKKKLEARTPLVDNKIKTDKPCGEELTKVIACEHEKFKTTTKEKIESIPANFTGNYDEILKGTLYDLLAHGVKNKEKKNNYEFEREDVVGIVDYTREQLSNEVKFCFFHLVFFTGT